MVNAASGLLQTGHHCIIAGKGNSVFFEKAKEKGIETFDINIFSDISIYHAFKLAQYIKKQKIDLVISKRRDLAVAGLAARWAGRLPVIVRSGSPPRKSLRKHVFLIRKLAVGLVTNTNTIRDIYRANALPDDNFIKVIYNGIQVDDNVSAFDFDARYPDRSVVLCVGRLNAIQKGYTFLIDALQTLKNDYPELLVYVLGDGKDRRMLESLSKRKGVAGNIHFAGYVDQPAPYMKGCNMFLHPSLIEGMPNAAMEAMAYGKPVIMTNVNGAAELTQDGKLAHIIPPASHKTIAESLKGALDNPHKFSKMAQAAQQHVREHFTMEKMIAGLNDFISEKSKEKRR